MSDLLQIEWKPRQAPLNATALAARGVAAVRLAQRLLLFEDEKLAHLEGVSAKDLLLITGKNEDLPWVEGTVYLGRDSDAPSILLSTVYEPSIPAALFERALMQKFKEQMPFAVLFDPDRIVSVGKALPVRREILEKWLANFAQ